ncbi:MAG TPA: hypothetical protein PLY34_18040 [Ferruginibacter sp.]|nr:hypothetical protein [Ferruginibacter sp.]HPH92718.1 hypothetical protein [Ferruginibacter sp.]
MKPKLLLPTNFYSLFCFVLFFCVISLQVQSQTAYDWYAKELANKEHNDYWASVVVDTVIKLEFVSTNPNSIAPASLRYGQAVDLKSFLRNKTVIIPGNQTFITAQIYFTGKGFPVPQVTTSTVQSSLAGLEYLLKKCETGTSVIFEVVRLSDSSKKNTRITGSCLFTNFQKKDLPVLLSVDTTIIDAMETLKKRFSRGTIYFAGTGFPVAESMPAAESNAINRKAMISRLQPGSSITFDNCNYWDAEKKIAVSVNKKIKLGIPSK